MEAKSSLYAFILIFGLLFSHGIIEVVSGSSLDAVPSHFPYKFKVVSNKYGGKLLQSPQPNKRRSQYRPGPPRRIRPTTLSRSTLNPPFHFKSPPT
ncbi:hypothetical protein SLEP1_g60355 [Rubroshorea leprosula]|uniref:Transmembrane protein n=1 Tax=Rubroshorea leprosula TaxID=152421 RepID=A0AAV5IUY5_9ROSI|nr:hypothetical protein SLEP1_g14838 [Rubroshorea leprosula]GKV53842.1 hypothetical protein SLEP1_g60355 [Rubroshorea leprosula]